VRSHAAGSHASLCGANVIGSRPSAHADGANRITRGHFTYLLMQGERRFTIMAAQIRQFRNCVYNTFNCLVAVVTLSTSRLNPARLSAARLDKNWTKFA
jgi:hypothetical protein